MAVQYRIAFAGKSARDFRMSRYFPLFVVGFLSFAGCKNADAQAVKSSMPSDVTVNPICTDRPTKSNAACTVELGHFQYESDLVNGSSVTSDGVTTHSWLILNPTFKYGLTPQMDVEANFSPLEIVTTHDKSGASQSVSGIGDLYLRLKYQFWNGDDLDIGVIPYLKAPTARIPIGNGAVEGGLIIPVNVKLSDSLTLTTVPEADLYKNAGGGGRHANMAQLINLAAALPGNFTLYGELWSDWNFDPSGTVAQYSADTALAYEVTDYLQLDAGLNFGLNRSTPDLQAYIGVSQKF
jgi:Putative MetA-pathway of phenol degradation